MIYKFLPDVKIAWGDVWVGSVITALLFTVGQVRDRALPGPERRRLALRRGGIARGAPGLDLLLVADPLLRRRVHQGLRQPPRLADRAPPKTPEPVTAEARAEQGLPTRGASQPRPLADGPHLRPPSRLPAPSPVAVPRRDPGPESGTSTGGGIPWGGLAAAAGVAALLYLRFRGEDEDEGDGDDDEEA